MLKSPLSPADREFVAEAERFFHNPSALIRGLNWFSGKVETGAKLMPGSVQKQIAKFVDLSLKKALAVSVKTVSKAPKHQSIDLARATAAKKSGLHSLASALAGGLSGYFGLPAVLIELPATTVLLLRSMLEVARECGEDIGDPNSALECLVVFCLGGPGTQDDLTDSAYYETRASLAMLVQAASNFIAANQSRQVLEAIERGSAPALVNLISRVATVFQVRVTKKMIAQATPVIGAAGGAAINLAFSNFYNRAALYHFGMRKLERKYGADVVKAAFLEAGRQRGQAN